MKIVYGCKYVHKSNLKELSKEDIELFIRCEDILKRKNFDVYVNYVVVKIDSENSSVSFIESDDFDTVYEPTVGDAHRITSDGEYKVSKKKKNPQIYHHKHYFVSDNYRGFNVEESKKRSKVWEEKMTDINKRKIGYKDYWTECLNRYGMEI